MKSPLPAVLRYVLPPTAALALAIALTGCQADQPLTIAANPDQTPYTDVAPSPAPFAALYAIPNIHHHQRPTFSRLISRHPTR